MNGGEKREVETERGKSINVSEAKGKERNPRPITQILLPTTTHDPASKTPSPSIHPHLSYPPYFFFSAQFRSGSRKKRSEKKGKCLRKTPIKPRRGG